MGISVRTINRPQDRALPPGPSNRFWGLANLFRIQGTKLLSFSELMASYGDTSYCQLGPYHLYFFNHPDLIHDLLVEQPDKFQKWSVQKRVVGKVVGNGTFNIDGDYWKQQRKLVQPAFHAKRIQGYFDVMVEETERLIASWE